MSAPASPPPPVKGVVPHLVVKGGTAAIEFYKKAFGAEALFQMPHEDGVRLLHAQLQINGGTLYLCDDFPEYRDGKPGAPDGVSPASVTIHQAVDDIDAAYAKAIAAGGTATMPPTDMFWGDRYGQLRCPFGHMWAMSTPIKK